MASLLAGLSLICAIAAFVCSIIILIAAFSDEFVKGLLCVAVYSVRSVKCELDSTAVADRC